MRLQAAYATDVGLVRAGNEDSLVVDDHLGLFAVADGMGGHVGGEVASTTAIEALRAAIAAGYAIEEAIQLANTAVYERSVDDDSLTGMGTTMTAFVPVAGSRFLIGHVGDSRAYLLRDRTLQRLTDDHSLVEELVRYGRITREQAEVHPQRNIVTRSLGVDPQLDVDIYTMQVATGDRLLLCSDGLTGMVREREIEAMLCSDDGVLSIAERLVAVAVENGGDDNVTVIVIDVVESDPEPTNEAESATPASEPDAEQAPEFGSPAVESRAEPFENHAPGATTAWVSEPERDTGGRWWRWPTRLVLMVLPIALIAAAGILTIRVLTYRQYYVGVADAHVAIYNGDPDGALWFDSRMVHAYRDLPVDALTQADRDNVGRLHGYCLHTSRAPVEACVERMRRSA